MQTAHLRSAFRRDTIGADEPAPRSKRNAHTLHLSTEQLRILQLALVHVCNDDRCADAIADILEEAMPLQDEEEDENFEYRWEQLAEVQSALQNAIDE